MKLIHDLYEKAIEELEEAECYADYALELKGAKPDIAAKLFRLSEEEVAQADVIMGIVTSLCEEKMREGRMSERDAIRCEVKQELYHEDKAEVRQVQAAYKI